MVYMSNRYCRLKAALKDSHLSLSLLMLLAIYSKAVMCTVTRVHQFALGKFLLFANRLSEVIDNTNYLNPW